jgi:hypothetical protein
MPRQQPTMSKGQNDPVPNISIIILLLSFQHTYSFIPKINIFKFLQVIYVFIIALNSALLLSADSYVVSTGLCQ